MLKIESWKLIAYVFQKYPESFTFQLFIIFHLFPREIYHFLNEQTFLTIVIVFSVYKQNFTEK